MIRVTYAVVPCAKVRQTQSDRWRQRPCVVRYRAFADELRRLKCELKDGDAITFWLPMPKSWSQKKCAAMRGKLHTQRPDLDNLLGGLMDAVMPESDSHVAFLGTVQKRWGYGAGIEITTASEKAPESLSEPQSALLAPECR